MRLVAVADAPAAEPARGAAAPAGGRGDGAGRGNAPVPTVNPEATPIVVNGIMYLPAGGRVLALEADTGKLVWEYKIPTRQHDGARRRLLAGRCGQSVSDTLHSRPSLDGRQRSHGRSLIRFRQGRIGRYQSGLERRSADLQKCGNTRRHGRRDLGGREPGDSRAFDTRTGAKLWEFHSVPQPGEPGHETWLDDGWKQRSGVNVWGWYLTLDEKTGTVYMPFGSPAGNYWGADRPGNNLFGNSVVAVDALTGKLKWYFQTVHHDLWDSDLPPAPVMVDIKQNGRTIPALAQIGKASVDVHPESRNR